MERHCVGRKALILGRNVLSSSATAKLHLLFDSDTYICKSPRTMYSMQLRHLPILWERPNCATWCCMHLSYRPKTCSRWQLYLDQLRNVYKVTQNIHIPWCFQLIVIAQWLMKPQCCCKSKIGNMYNGQSTSDFHMNKRIYMHHITYDIILPFQRTDAEWRIDVCTRPPFVHIMACHLICTKRLSTPMPCYC